MADIFKREPIKNLNIAKAENMGLVLDGATKDLFYVQQVQWNYAQRISRLFDLAHPDSMLYVSARPEGALSIVHAVSDAKTILNIFEKLGSVCDATKNTISTTFPDAKNCEKRNNATKISFMHCLLSSVGVSQSVQDYVINDSMQIMFSYVKRG